jgi:hypothetical protein
MGSPVGWASPKPVGTTKVVVLDEAGVGIFNVTATVAIVEIAARSVSAIRNKTFIFNFSPPFLFFNPER